MRPGRPYYSQTFGNNETTFFVVDAETLSGDRKQLEWLKTECLNSTSIWKILMIHKPLVSSRLAHGAADQLYKLLLPVMTKDRGIDVVFSGHNHVYERRMIENGIQHITDGSGSMLVHDPFPEDPERIVGYNNSRAFVIFQVEGDQMRLRAINEEGETIDEFGLRDMDAPPAPSPTVRSD